MYKVVTGTSLALATALIMPAIAQAQEGREKTSPSIVRSTNDGQHYTPADFTSFAPRTALDMIEKIPGFQIITDTNGGDRGLGQAKQNILINGERIASKSTSARTALSRVTADQVASIDIVDGASLNVPGLTGQVANVILVAGGHSGKFKTTILWNPDFRPRLPDNWFNGEISTTGNLDGTDVTISLHTGTNRNGHWGPEEVFDGSGTLQFTRDEFARYYGDRPRLAAALSRTTANGNKWNLNLGGQLVYLDQATDGISVQPGAGTVRERYDYTEHDRNYDIGGDYEMGLGHGRLKLIALHQFDEHSPTVSRFVIDREIGGKSGNRFTRGSREAESILRSEYSWSTSGGTDWQVALEGAYNTLDVKAELAELQADDSFLPIIFGGERTKVQEKRSELSLSWGRPLASNLSAQVNLGAEYSELSSSGPGGLTRRFIRPKGKVALAWKVAPKTTINFLLQRRVDQLDFLDFASSVDVANNQGNGGNARLVPPIVNRTELEVVQDLGRWGHVSVAAAYGYAQDLVDQIPLSPTTEGRGNLPGANLYRLSSQATLLLDPVGWKGARIDSEITLRRNRVRDPLIGLWRNQSNGQEHLFDLALRDDIPGSQIAWGIKYYHEQYSPGLRLDSINHEFTAGPFVTLFVEHKNVAGFTVRASFQNLAGSKDALDRTVYVNRRLGPVAFSESRRRKYGQLLELTVTGTI